MIKSPFSLLSLIFIGYLGLIPVNVRGVRAQNTPQLYQQERGSQLIAQSTPTKPKASPQPTVAKQSDNLPLPLIIGSLLLSLAVVGILISLLSKYRPSLNLDKKERLKTIAEGSRSKTADSNNSTKRYGLYDSEYEEIAPESSLQVQATSKIPNPDLVLSLLESLKDENPKNRRRAIWKLAQMSDSRAMQPMVEAMLDGDSYERSLILEALAQICTRTLRPMNQALAISLQDKNPQVRKNAIRDLTRIYDIMSQITQLIAHAIDDNDPEVQETAKWAMRQLNVQLPPRMDIGPMETVGEPEDIEDSTYTETTSTEVQN